MVYPGRRRQNEPEMSYRLVRLFLCDQLFLWIEPFYGQCMCLLQRMGFSFTFLLGMNSMMFFFTMSRIAA